MIHIEFRPRYSSKSIRGRCVRRLVLHEINKCLRELLDTGSEDPELGEKYEALVSFLTSPGFEQLHDASERYLSDGKDVSVVFHTNGHGPSYTLKVQDP